MEPNAVFVGIAGFRALDLLASAGRHPKQYYRHDVLFDVNPRQVTMMNAVMTLIAESATPSEFIEKFSTYYERIIHPGKRKGDRYLEALGAGHPRYQPPSRQDILDWLETKRLSSGSFLEKENFYVIKDLVASGGLHTMIMDLSDRERAKTFKRWMDDNQLIVKDMYVSTALEFLKAERKFSYWGDVAKDKRGCAIETIKNLCGKNARLLYSKPPPKRSPGDEFQLGIADSPEKMEEVLQQISHGNATLYRTLCSHRNEMVELAHVADDENRLHITNRLSKPFTNEQIRILRQRLKPLGFHKLEASQDNNELFGRNIKHIIADGGMWKQIEDAVRASLALPAYQHNTVLAEPVRLR